MITINYSELFTIILSVLGIILLIYLIAAVRNLLPVLKSLQKITSNAEDLSEKAHDTAQQVSKIAVDASDTFESIAGIVKKNGSSLNAVTNLVNASASLVKLFKEKK